jgi:DNA-binding protein H-NS
MAKFSLSSMSVDDLLALRDRIGKVLSSKAVELQRQLSKLATTAKSSVGIQKRRGPKKGQKVPPKYRGPHGETWSGRGLRPKWLTAELKSGHKLDDFLIGRRGRRKRGRKRKAG